LKELPKILSFFLYGLGKGDIMSTTPLHIHLTKHPEFKVIHVNGALIALKADEGFMKFFLDIVEPKIKTGGKSGDMELDKINREFQVEVRMSAMTFMQIFQYMDANLKELEKKGILKRGKKPPKVAETYRV